MSEKKIGIIGGTSTGIKYILEKFGDRLPETENPLKLPNPSSTLPKPEELNISIFQELPDKK